MNFQSYFTRLLMLMLFFGLSMSITQVQAQSSNEQISWGDDDDEEEAEEEKAFEEVVLTINGEVMDLNLEQYSFEREIDLEYFCA